MVAIFLLNQRAGWLLKSTFYPDFLAGSFGCFEIRVVLLYLSIKVMEDGGIDTTIIDSRQQRMGRFADFPPLLTSSVFDV